MSIWFLNNCLIWKTLLCFMVIGFYRWGDPIAYDFVVLFNLYYIVF
jgi:hypothetical protein